MKWTGKHDAAALAERIRALLKGRRGIAEKKMFGGVCFLLRENMLCGAGRNGFMFRVGKERHAAAKARKGAVPVRMSGRRMAGFFWVDPARCDARGLRSWLALAEDYVGALPARRK